jgi:hypothetical protein
MVLPMTRPYQHPRTGVYWLRKVIPAPLCPIVGKRELKASLGTKDPAGARDRAPAVLERFNAIIGSAQARQRGEAPSLTARAMWRRCEGDWSPDENLSRFPDPSPVGAPNAPLRP